VIGRHATFAYCVEITV